LEPVEHHLFCLVRNIEGNRFVWIQQ
jgi:hypothetical protein